MARRGRRKREGGEPVRIRAIQALTRVGMLRFLWLICHGLWQWSFFLDWVESKLVSDQMCSRVQDG